MPSKQPRTYYVNRGICPNCKSRKLEGYSICEVCREAQRKYQYENRERKAKYQRERYERLKNARLCVACTRPANGGIYCDTCQDDHIRWRQLNRMLHSRNKWAKR